jgi:hypothetical protein
MFAGVAVPVSSSPSSLPRCGMPRSTRPPTGSTARSPTRFPTSSPDLPLRSTSGAQRCSRKRSEWPTIEPGLPTDGTPRTNVGAGWARQGLEGNAGEAAGVEKPHRPRGHRSRPLPLAALPSSLARDPIETAPSAARAGRSAGSTPNREDGGRDTVCTLRCCRHRRRSASSPLSLDRGRRARMAAAEPSTRQPVRRPARV